MWGWLPGRLVCLGRVVGSGSAGAAPAEAVAGCPARLCGVAGCRVLCGVEDTPVLLLLPVFVWGWGLVGAPVWGWHAVGVLGQCALVARPVWVSVLCVLCLVWWGCVGGLLRVWVGWL